MKKGVLPLKDQGQLASALLEKTEESEKKKKYLINELNSFKIRELKESQLDNQEKIKKLNEYRFELQEKEEKLLKDKALFKEFEKKG